MQNLKQLAEKFSIKLIDSMTGFVFIKDCSSVYHLVNKAFCRISGLQATMIEGGTDATMPWQCYTESIKKMDEQIFSREERHTYIEPTYFVNRQAYTLLTKKIPIKNNANQLIGLLGQCTVLANPNILKKTKLLTKTDLEEFGIFPTFYNIKDVIPNLTKQESICLFHYIRGKTSREIASQLAISHRTVEHYLESIKIKLNCKNKSELIEKAFSEGYIYIVPAECVQHFA